MTHIYYEREKPARSNILWVLFVSSRPVSLHIHLPPPDCLPSPRPPLADRQRPAFIYAHGLCDEPRGVTMFVVKRYKSGQLRGTRSEPRRRRRRRPSADKALLIQTDRVSSEEDLSMCQLPGGRPQITGVGRAPGIYGKSRGLGGQQTEDPE